MIEFGEIVWTAMERAADGSGDTRYFGSTDGVRLYVVHGVGSANDRKFTAYRLTADGTEYPVGEGGSLRRLSIAKGRCLDELDTYTERERIEWIESRKERRTLLGVLDAVGSAREAHRMTLTELRDAVAGLKPIKVEMDAPRPEQLDEYDDGATVWRVGDRVKFPGPVFEVGDVWQISSITVPTTRPPYAGLRLVHRAGGLPLGETGTALGLRFLSRIAATAPDPADEIAQLRHAVEVALARAEHAERDRRLLRQQIERRQDELRADAQRALAERVVDVRKALLLLRDDHLRQWLAVCIENDESRQLRDRVTDPEAYPLHAEDVRTMIADVARELGVEL